MVQEYLDKLTEMVNIAIPMDLRTNLHYKHFFYGAAAYVYDKIFCTYTPSGVAIKISQEERDQLLSSSKGTELRYFAKSPVKKDYVILGSEIIDNSKQLNYWILMAFDYIKK